MADVDQALVERMEKLVRYMAECDRMYGPAKGNEHYTEAREIVALLPEPEAEETPEQLRDRFEREAVDHDRRADLLQAEASITQARAAGAREEASHLRDCIAQLDKALGRQLVAGAAK